MQSRYLLITLFSIGTFSLALAHEEVTYTEFVKLPPKAAFEILEKAGGLHDVRQYVEAAIASQKLELINACLLNNYGSVVISESISRMPESEFKDALIILKIEAGPNVWSPDGDPNEREGSTWAILKRNHVEEPYASLIKRLLPNHPLDPGEFEWQAKRVKLGAELRAALQARERSPIEEPAEVKKPPSEERSTGRAETGRKPQSRSEVFKSALLTSITAAGIWFLFKNRNHTKK